MLVGATVGPRGDGHVPGELLTPEEYAEHHRPQLANLGAADADPAELRAAHDALGLDVQIWAAAAAPTHATSRRCGRAETMLA